MTSHSMRDSDPLVTQLFALRLDLHLKRITVKEFRAALENILEQFRKREPKRT